MSKILLSLALLFSADAALAADQSWFETMVKGLRTKVQKKLQSRDRVSAVAAVRGAKQGGDPFALYWKGGVSEAALKKLDADKEALAAAVQLVVEGREAEGRAALEAFLKDSSESFYAADAREALDKLGPAAAVPAAPAKPAPAEEKKAE